MSPLGTSVAQDRTKLEMVKQNLLSSFVCGLVLQMKVLTVALFDFLQKPALGIRGEVWAKNCIFSGTIFSLKIGVLLGKYFRKQTNS